MPNPKSIHERDNVINSFKKINYDVIYDALSNKTKFISPDGFSIEFLTKLNRNNLNVVELGKTKIYAESLSYVDIFGTNYIEICYNSLIVKVIHPAIYVFQKLLISDQRKDKADKDILSITELMKFINKSKNYSNELKVLFNNLPKSWKNKITKTIINNNLSPLFLFIIYK